jgi:hypothetical protein
MLNILDVPANKASRPSIEIPKGRPASKIIAPRPQKPNQVRQIVEAEYSQPSVEELTGRFAKASFDSDSDDYDSCPSALSDRSSNASSPSSLSSLSDRSTSSNCSCERYGITRKGDRVKLDCGGSRCGYSDDSCSSESEQDEINWSPRSARRNAIHVRR